MLHHAYAYIYAYFLEKAYMRIAYIPTQFESECGIEMRQRGERRELLINFTQASYISTVIVARYALGRCFDGIHAKKWWSICRRSGGVPAEEVVAQTEEVVAPAAIELRTSGKRRPTVSWARDRNIVLLPKQWTSLAIHWKELRSHMPRSFLVMTK